MNKFWHWKDSVTSDGDRTLYLDGPIDSDTWWGDEATPQDFKAELSKGTGPVTIWINSPGGDVTAAAQMYDMIMDYKGDVTGKITGMAASAATIVAMACDTLLISPTAMMMIHKPSTYTDGNADDLKEAIKILNEVEESIINAYEAKTMLPREQIAKLMSNGGTWMNANKAIELGFADGLLERSQYEGEPLPTDSTLFSPQLQAQAMLRNVQARAQPVSHEPQSTTQNEPQAGINVEPLRARLQLLSKLF